MFFSSCLQQSLHLRVSCDYISFQIQLTASFDARFLISQDPAQDHHDQLLSWRFSLFRLVCSISHSKRRPNPLRAGRVTLWLRARVCNVSLKINVLNTLGMSNLSPNHKPRCEYQPRFSKQELYTIVLDTRYVDFITTQVSALGAVRVVSKFMLS